MDVSPVYGHHAPTWEMCKDAWESAATASRKCAMATLDGDRAGALKYAQEWQRLQDVADELNRLFLEQ